MITPLAAGRPSFWSSALSASAVSDSAVTVALTLGLAATAADAPAPAPLHAEALRPAQPAPAAPPPQNDDLADDSFIKEDPAGDDADSIGPDHHEPGPNAARKDPDESSSDAF